MKPVLAVVIEAQLSTDGRKRRAWPAYVATLYARLGCPVELLVVCAKPAVATWCGVPIVIGRRCLVLTPLVLGPHQIPVITEPEQARVSPELAVLSTIAHVHHADQKAVFGAFMAALDVIDRDHANMYADVVLAALPPATRNYLETLMGTVSFKYTYQSEFARRYYSQGEAEGEAKGEARAVLRFLAARGIDVSETVREQITTCTDLDRLDAWVDRALTVTTAAELLDD